MIKKGIYQHYKHGHFYKVIHIAYHHDWEDAVAIYYRCDENGVFKSIRDGEIIVKQPFYRPVSEFDNEVLPGVVRFKFIKECE